jgi:hypothetical protein
MLGYVKVISAFASAALMYFVPLRDRDFYSGWQLNW